MGNRIKRALFILMRLYHNQAGNTLAIVAAAVIPLAALIGGGVDMSRAYMVRARMQQACDASALAGRRAMTTSSMTTANIAEAKRFFDFNFPQGTFGAASFTPMIQSKPGETTTVQVSATTTIPTTIMRIFGKETMEIAVNCDSRFDIGNTDVMLVLDTTGSMANSISDGNGGTTTRIAALQQAVKDFYDTLGPGSDTLGRIRYGFVPYTSTVNVGYQLPSSALIGGTSGETWNYQTRRMTYYNNTAITTSICYRKYNNGTCYITLSSAESSSGGTRTPSQCTSWGNASTIMTGNAPSNMTRVIYAAETWNGQPIASASGNQNKSCVRRETTTTHATGYTAQSGWSEYQMEFGSFPLDASDFIKGASVPNPTYYASTPRDANSTTVSSTSTWNGCIEERSTDSSIDSSTSTSSVPSTAYDLQIDTAPTTMDTKWRPHWPDVEFKRNGRWMNDNIKNSSLASPMTEQDNYRAGTGGWNACPSQSRKLTSYSSRSAIPAGQTSSFDGYVNGLVAVGGTYHDIGMIWGARFLSPDGIFASENATAPNGFNISRNIVFMTDGAMSPNASIYGAWGYQQLDQRDGTSSSALLGNHKRRLEIICNAIKAKNITIWIVGFLDTGESLDSEVQNCASSTNHVMVAYDAATLKQNFKDIAKNIGGLRLSN